MASPDVFIEITRFVSKKAYRDDPSIIHRPLDLISQKAYNSFGIWTGLQVEDQETLYMTVAWRAVEDHYAFMADKEHWAKCHEAYDPCGTFDINIRGSLIHVPFNSDPYIHMNKAVTEFTMMELKPAENAESIESVLRREFEEREALLKDEGLSRGRFTWGCPGEIEGLYVIMTGWDSVEDSEEFRRKHAIRLSAFTNALKQIATGDTTRYQLTKFEN